MIAKIENTTTFEQRKPLVDEFYRVMEEASNQIMVSSDYKSFKSGPSTTTSKSSSPLKESTKCNTPQKNLINLSGNQVSPSKGGKSPLKKNINLSASKKQGSSLKKSLFGSVAASTAEDRENSSPTKRAFRITSSPLKQTSASK